MDDSKRQAVRNAAELEQVLAGMRDGDRIATYQAREAIIQIGLFAPPTSLSLVLKLLVEAALNESAIG